MHSPNPSAFAFFPPFAYLYRVRSGKKDSKKVRLLLLQTSSKTVIFFLFKIFGIYKRTNGSFTAYALYY